MGFKVYVKSVYAHLWRKPIHFKSSQRVLENKNVNGQSTTHKYPMYTAHTTPPALDVLLFPGCNSISLN